MRSALTTAVFAFLLVGCATHQASNASVAEQSVPRCEVVDCTEPAADLHAPDGATLAFETCTDGAKRSYAYERSREKWVLTAYSMAVVSACPTKGE
jgi:uncharacterized protein YcfL